MADFTLENFHRKQAQKVTQSIIEQTEKQEQKIQQDGLIKWQQAHQYLVNILRELDQDYDEVCEKNNHPIISHSDEDLFFLIRSRLRIAKQTHLIINSEIDRNQNQFKQLQAKFDDLEETSKQNIEKNRKTKSSLYKRDIPQW